MVPRETGNNAYANFLRDKQRVLWYFLCWPIPSYVSGLMISKVNPYSFFFFFFFFFAQVCMLVEVAARESRRQTKRAGDE